MSKPMSRRISNDELDAALTAIHRHLDFTDLRASREQILQEIRDITAHTQRVRARREETRKYMEQLRREPAAGRSPVRRSRYKHQLSFWRLFWHELGYRKQGKLGRQLELLMLLYAAPHQHWAGREKPPWTQDDDDPTADREDPGIRRAAAAAIVMSAGLTLWILLTAAFSSVLSPGAAIAVAGGMIVIIALVVMAVIACSRNVRMGWGAREPAGPAGEVWKTQD
jgi:hypothetical protein